MCLETFGFFPKRFQTAELQVYFIAQLTYKKLEVEKNRVFLFSFARKTIIIEVSSKEKVALLHNNNERNRKNEENRLYV